MESQDKKIYKVVDIRSSIKNKYLKFLYSIIERPLEAFLGITDLNETYDRLVKKTSGNFFKRAVEAIGVDYEISETDLKKIPREGGLVVVSNHPLGGLDGIVLGAVLLSVREDAKIILNGLLANMPEIKEYAICVNPFGGKSATAQNVSSMKDTIRLLKNGGCVGTFPSGTVSHIHVKDCCISDPEWNTNIAQIARRTKANILPVYFDGRNSWLFYLAGLIHPRLRTLLLIREMFYVARRKKIQMHVGGVISARKVSEFQNDEELTSWLRINSYVLGGRNNKGEKQDKTQLKIIQRSIEKIFPMMHKEMQDLILPIDPQLIEKEISALPESACMISGEKISVYCAEAWQIPWAMLEIGRLREETFREVGEGTGKSIDTDEFDQYYLHMFMWDAENKKIAGAYRIGRTDKIMNSLGVQGLYASTLFKIKRELIDRISPALEMGRSFVASQYQKKRSTLAILWRGIGEYLYRNPQYRVLYGPVSISAQYNSISKDLMVQFLMERKTSEELAKFVKAKNPPKVSMKSVDIKALMEGAADIDHVSALVSEVEIDNKGIPTLLKHYLKLDGELLAFNVDDEFGSCIDGLIMVDLLKTDPKLLKSYMGEKQTIEYRKYHGVSEEQ
ncbi:MAG: lysophospholipid acyltransferase family protein [Opitutales bacterium]|nr:lysophospholipid acyltransferase family protein [Opitutales bacterium]MBQ2722527.1 lysophospholipid acyltransferase family protein [Opitutales bacterium]